MALSPGWKRRSSTRWIPWLGASSGAARRIVQPPQAVGEDAGGVDHHPGADLALGPGLGVADADAAHPPALLDQADDRQVVDRHAAEVGERSGRG